MGLVRLLRLVYAQSHSTQSHSTMILVRGTNEAVWRKDCVPGEDGYWHSLGRAIVGAIGSSSLAFVVARGTDDRRWSFQPSSARTVSTPANWAQVDAHWRLTSSPLGSSPAAAAAD